jgi:hypothetical protein
MHFAAYPRLNLFQSLLPDILEKAYGSKEGARATPIVIWGVTLDPNGKKDAHASVVLMKWLRAKCVLHLSADIVHVLIYAAKKLECERCKDHDDRDTSVARGVQDRRGHERNISRRL